MTDGQDALLQEPLENAVKELARICEVLILLDRPSLEESGILAVKPVSVSHREFGNGQSILSKAARRSALAIAEETVNREVPVTASFKRKGRVK